MTHFKRVIHYQYELFFKLPRKLWLQALLISLQKVGILKAIKLLFVKLVPLSAKERLQGIHYQFGRFVN